MLIQRLLHILFILLACSIIDSQCQKNYLVDRHVSNAVFPIQQPFRIPKTLKPLDYWIRVQPYFPLTDVEGEKRKDPPGGGANMTFEGQTTFLFEVVKETKELILHSVKLNYKKILLMNIKGEQLEDLTSLEELEAKRERVTVKPISTTLSVGSKYVLYFEYSGKINRYTEGGIYYTSYMEGKTQHWMIATHMEPGYARSVFPCLDEPDYKAIFHITLIYPRKEGYIALANMLERPAVRYDDHFDIIQFPPSPKMSSYLVAFTVGPLVNQQRINEAGTLVRIWGWTGQEHYLDFSADTAAKCLYQLGVYLDYTFPLKKSDQVGLPEFVAGAMENYGLIIYKYEYISFFDKLGSTLVRQAAARVICHELAHQWFGDTVTAMFWDDIFLNEGFAAYFENFGQQLALPIQRDMQIWKFLVESEQQGLVSDADLNYPTHPIYNASGSAFDDITYLKGASVLRMTRFTLGDDVFQNALKKYIKKYEFSNANHEMLYDIFTEAASEGNIKDWCGRPLNVTKFLDPWMLQKGFPLVTVTNNQLMGDAVYTQEPFIMQQLDKNPYEYKWPIPFFVKDYKTGKDNLNWIIPDYYKCKRSAESNAVHWYKGNAKLRSFVRVQYDDIGYTRLIKQLKEKPEDFETEDQIALIGDQIALLKRKRDAGLPFSFNKVLTVLTTILPRNIHFAVFEISAPIIDEIEIYFQGSEDFELFERFIRDILGESYKKLNWKVSEGEDMVWDTNLALYSMYPYAVRYNVGDAVKRGADLFQEMLRKCKSADKGITDCNPIPVDLRRAVYCAGIKSGTSGDFDKLLEFYHQQKEAEPYFYQEYNAMLEGLGCTTSKTDVEKFIPILEEAKRLPQDKYKLAPPPFLYLALNPIAGDVMYEYIKKYPTKISEGHIREYLAAMTVAWFSKEQGDKLLALKDVLTGERGNVLMKIHEKVQQRIIWHENHFPDIARFFYDKYVVEGKNPWKKTLPEDLRPIECHLDFQPYFPAGASYGFYKNLTFEAKATIKFVALQPTNSISLNVHRLLLRKSKVFLCDSGISKGCSNPESIKKDYDSGIATFVYKNRLEKGKEYQMTFDYIGFIYNGRAEGVYTNWNYFEFNDKHTWMFNTQFEGGPSSRSLVPSFDEPKYRYAWTVRVKHSAEMTALSNTLFSQKTIEVDRNNRPTGWAITEFQQTPNMTSYLLAVAIGNLAHVATISNGGVLVRVWAWTGMEQYGEIALKTVSGTLDFLGDYFKTPFALPKLDVVAFPQYTGRATALENWGLVCGIYKGVLVDPIYSGPEEYESVAHVMAHEIAHQWFGNYVTLREWRWLFLNEAFANYWFTHGVNHAFPKQHQMSKLKRFWILEKALRSDANPRRSTAVISDEGRLFGYQSYHKGSSLLGMLNYTLGDKVLQIGVTNYLHNNAYGTATPESLWTELTKAAKGLKGWEENRPLNVGEMMKTWMEKKGFPLISVRTEDGRLMFEQKSMLPEDKTTTWVIPIFVQTKNGEEMHYFYGKDGTNKYWKERKLSDGWQVINAGAKSFIRVWYDDNSWNPIFDQLKRNSKVFDELTKAKFISDIAVQAEQDARFWPRLLTLMSEYLSQETEFAPLHTASSIMDKLWINFRRSEMKGDVERFLRKCLGQYVKNSLWAKSDNWKTQMMNSMVTDFACKYNAEQCRDTAGTFFNEFLNNCEYTGEGTGSCIRQPPELRKPVYCYGLRRKPEAVPTLTRMHNWFYEHSRYFTKDAEDMLNGISCVEGKNLESVISKAINGLYPPEIFDNIADNDDSGLELWNYFVSNVEHVVFGVPSFADYIGAATDGWNTQKDIDRIEQFMTSEKGAALSTDNHQLLETAKKNIRENIKWMSTHGKAVSEWIKSKSTFTARIEA